MMDAMHIYLLEALCKAADETLKLQGQVTHLQSVANDLRDQLEARNAVPTVVE